MIRAQRAQSFGNVILGKPFDFLGNSVRFEFFNALRANKLYSACAVLSHVGNQSKNIPRRNLKAPAPVLKNLVVVGQ